MCNSVPEVLSELIRTAFVPKEGYKFIVSDFAAVEVHMLSFLANETWRLKVFADNGDICGNVPCFRRNAIKTLSHCFVCVHVHGELMIERSMVISLDAVCEQMGPPRRSADLISGRTAMKPCSTRKIEKGRRLS